MTINSVRHPDQQREQVPAQASHRHGRRPIRAIGGFSRQPQTAFSFSMPIADGSLTSIPSWKRSSDARSRSCSVQSSGTRRVCRQRIQRRLLRALREHGYVRDEHLSIETTIGRAMDVELVGNTYVAGDVTVAQFSIRDITERTLVEKQLLKQADEQADLIRRKDEFFAVLSHELRSPLSAIINAVTLLRHDPCALPVHEQAGAIVARQVAQLRVMLDDLLELARATTGRVRLRRERVDLRCIVTHAVETVRSDVERRKHELSWSQPCDPVWLDVDPSRMEQVVVNLLTNAAKYALEAGLISLTVGREGDEVAIRVRDTGIGISSKLLPHVFDHFTQAHTSLHRSEGGLGIGLTVVQRLVQLHGGTVTASSAGLGLGSEFVVRLPTGLASEPRSGAAHLPPITEGSAKQRRLLVVDHNEDAADTLAEVLRLFGHEVQVAYSGVTALETATTNPPDAVLVEVGLPGLSGYEIATRLRQDPKVEINSVCLIATTGYGMRTDRVRIRQAGFDHHLVKPVDPRRLQHLFAQLGS